MEEAKDTAIVTSIFTKLAHYKPYFVIFTMQNLFFQSREARNRTLNVQYMIIFKARCDSTQITHLGSQMYPNKKGFLQNCFADATMEKHSYLFIDLHQDTSEAVRLRVKILPYEQPMMAYVHKQYFNAKGCL